MRLWHYKLIHYLPRQQLLSQWRELNSIFVKQDKHILINYIYEYDKIDLYLYSRRVINEIISRGYKIKSFDNFEKYFESDALYWITKEKDIFVNHHNENYLKICCWNLYEKYLRGQTGFTRECILFIEGVIGLL